MIGVPVQGLYDALSTWRSPTLGCCCHAGDCQNAQCTCRQDGFDLFATRPPSGAPGREVLAVRSNRMVRITQAAQRAGEHDMWRKLRRIRPQSPRAAEYEFIEGPALDPFALGRIVDHIQGAVDMHASGDRRVDDAIFADRFDDEARLKVWVGVHVRDPGLVVCHARLGNRARRSRPRALSRRMRAVGPRFWLTPERLPMMSPWGLWLLL